MKMKKLKKRLTTVKNKKEAICWIFIVTHTHINEKKRDRLGAHYRAERTVMGKIK